MLIRLFCGVEYYCREHGTWKIKIISNQKLALKPEWTEQPKRMKMYLKCQWHRQNPVQNHGYLQNRLLRRRTQFRRQQMHHSYLERVNWHRRRRKAIQAICSKCQQIRHQQQAKYSVVLVKHPLNQIYLWTVRQMWFRPRINQSHSNRPTLPTP